MMLRPATPLSVLLLVAFGLLLIATLSTPIITKISLGAFDGASFGVFGFCTSSGCSKIEIGYDGSQAFKGEQSSDFNLPASTRATLSSILIVHPVAALLTLIMLILAGVSHVHAPSHSARYLLLLFIVSIINLLVCLLAFLVDVLLFVPHMTFGSYLVLAAVILVAFSTIISCAMRRTLVNRKARKKRIAENAEMSGENYYNRQTQQPSAPSTTTAQPTMPSMAGANGAAGEKPSFATFEGRTARTSDERIPLTARSPSNRSPNDVPVDMATSDATMYNNATPGRSPSVPRDQYGNPIMGGGPQNAYGGAARRPSNESMGSRARGGPGSIRSRGGGGGGGYGPRGGMGPPQQGRGGGYGQQGRGGAYGPPGGRGGYGQPSRGYAGGGMMRGGRQQPAPGYGQGPYDRRDMAGGNAGPYGQSAPVSGPGYAVNPSMPSVSTGSAGAYGAYEADRESDLPRAESPPPLANSEALASSEALGPPGQAVAMDHRTGSSAHPPQNFGNLRDSDTDIAGMVGLQQERTQPQRHDTYMSEASKYSQDEQYQPIRQAWNPDAPRAGSPMHNSPLRPGPGRVVTPPNAQRAAGRQSSDTYYEDVDARFAEPEPYQQHPQQQQISSPPLASRSPPPHHLHPAMPSPIRTSPSYDDVRSMPPGSRSPVDSERSTFTSISQRGINPRWNAANAAPMPQGPYGPGGGGGGQMLPPPRRPINRQKDMVLDSNPDFQIAGSGPGGRGPGGGAGGMGPASRGVGGGMIPGSAYPGSAM